MDTFVDSSWYQFRTARRLWEGPFRPSDLARWAPVDLYVGGVEHAILTCCTRGSSQSCRTWDADSVSRSPGLLNQGQVINAGKAMSKTLGNGVDLASRSTGSAVDPCDDNGLRLAAGG